MVRGGVGPSSSPPPTHKLGVSDPKKIMNGFKNRLVHDWDMKGQTPAYHNYIEAAKTVTDRMAAYWKAERAFSKDPSDEQTMATLVYARRAYLQALATRDQLWSASHPTDHTPMSIYTQMRI